MADDKAKKTKIDLKARLGKTTLVGMNAPGTVPLPVPGSHPGLIPQPSDSGPAGSGPSAPPSMTPIPGASQSVRPPSGIAPPPGLSPGIPVPPFGPRIVQQQAPAPKPTAAQQTIKVEMGEEIEQHRSSARRNALLAALAGAIVGGLIGFVAGGSSEKGTRSKDAAKGAAALEKDVREATKKMKELGEALTEGGKSLGNKTFPSTLAATLGGINIPFDTTNLDGKHVGSLPSKVLRPLLAFTAAAEDVNKTKDSLKNLLGLSEAPVTKAWKDEKDPIASFSVLFRSDGQNKVVAELVPIKEPFSWKADFPAAYTITKLENGKPAPKEATRWVKGDLVGGNPIGIPIDPRSMAGFTGEVLIQRLNKAIYDVRVVLEGNADDPTRPVPGLLKDGDDLANELRKAGLNQ